jgi:hypothetical protein
MGMEGLGVQTDVARERLRELRTHNNPNTTSLLAQLERTKMGCFCSGWKGPILRVDDKHVARAEACHATIQNQKVYVNMGFISLWVM